MQWRGRDRKAYERAQELLEWPMIVLSLAFVPIILAPLVWELPASIEDTLEATAWLIWAAFAGEYLVLLWLAPDRRHMIRTHVLDLLIVLLPFLRPLRAARVLRLLRLAAVAGRFSQGVRRLLGRRGFTPFLVVVGAVVTTCGAGVWILERDVDGAQITTVADGLWWAIVTSTTVGYGDLVPVTAAGRGIATLLMFVGVALLSVVTANIAAFFVEESNAEHAAVVTRLDRIEQLLTDRTNPRPDGDEPLGTGTTRTGTPPPPASAG